jgi:hypothetical protein
MATTNRILIKSKSGAAGAPSTSDLQVGELAVNTYTGLAYLGTNTTNSGLSAGGSPTEVSTIGMPVDTSGSLGSSDVKLATQNAIKTYVDTATAANRDIDALDALSSVGNIHQTNDHFLISDAGTEKKITFSDLEDEIFGNISSDITVAAGGAATIGDNKIGADELNVSGDGTSSQFLRSDGDGTFTWATPSTGTATAMTVADESSDTTCFPLFVTAATGDLAPKSGSNLTFDSADGILTATSFVGNITGNVTGSLILDGNTISGIDDSGEFTDDDNHIMTSAGVADKIEGYSYITASSSDTLSNKTIAASQVTEISNITAAEGAQIENIDSTTISATQWGYLGAASGAITNTDTDVTNANLLTRLAALESSGGSGDENITIGTDSGDTIVITGNLQVSGTTTTVNSTTVNLNDHNIVLDSGNDTSAVVNGAGITLEGGSGDDATFTYSTTGPQFEMKLGSSYEDLQIAKLTATELDISGDADIDGTLEADAITVGGTALNTVIAGVTVSNATLAATTTVTDSSANTDFPIVFHNESNGLLDDTGAFEYNPSTGTLVVANLDIGTDVDVDGTLETDALTVGGTTIAELIADTAGAMFTGNTETGITATYQDADNTIDLVVGTLNQDTSGTAAIATTVTVADESSDTTCFPLFVTAATGDLAPKSGSNLAFNSSSGALTATSFVGDLTGDVTGNADTSTKIASITNSNIVQLTATQTLTNKTIVGGTFS